MNEDGTLQGGDPSLLQQVNLSFVQPERMQALDVGYKAAWGGRFLTDVSAYLNHYRNFISSDAFISVSPTKHQGEVVPAGTRFLPYFNAPAAVLGYGAGAQVSYHMPFSNLITIVNYDYAGFRQLEQSDTPLPPFNTPPHRLNLSLQSYNLLPRSLPNLGMNINYLWMDSFSWRASFGSWIVPSYGQLSTQVNYRLPRQHLLFKLGGTNLLADDYRSFLGASFIGRQYYVSITYDEFL